MDKKNMAEKFAFFGKDWQPDVMNSLTNQDWQIAKGKSEFPWHAHANEDKLFFVWKGHFRVEFRDRVIELNPGEAIVVPRGTEHKTVADEKSEILLLG